MNNAFFAAADGAPAYMLYVAGQSNSAAEGTTAVKTAPSGWVSDSSIKIWDATGGRISSSVYWPVCDGAGDKGLYYWRPKVT